MKDFDLQLFDEEVAESSGESTAENSSTESTSELPEGFEGLEEFKDEILQELSGEEKSEETEEQSEYKSKDEEIAALKKQIEESKWQSVQSQQQQPVQQTPQQLPRQPQMQAPPPMQVTPEFMAAYKKATNALAMQMAGMSEKDLKELEFADEDDPNLQRWQLAQKMAANKVQADIQQARQNQAMQAQRYMNIRNAAVQSYNEYSAREMKETDFEQVKNFAVGELFKVLPMQAQLTLSDSYNKIVSNQATPAEIMLVQNYFAQAKAIYRSQKGRQKNNQSARNAADKLPKIDNLNGASGSVSNGYSVKDLEKIIDETTDFDKLDPKIRKLFEY